MTDNVRRRPGHTKQFLERLRDLFGALPSESEKREAEAQFSSLIEFLTQLRQNLRELLEAKLKGEEISVPEPVAEAPVIDLLEALKQSVAATKPRSGDGAKATAKKAAPRKRAAARK